jgi:hypothetical protein
MRSFRQGRLIVVLALTKNVLLNSPVRVDFRSTARFDAGFKVTGRCGAHSPC